MAKQQIAAPIDKPLAKSYLRQFTGWSTAYPPGVSDPTSLRLMENVFITREGAAAVRPGLRSALTENVFLDTTYHVTLVGSFEHFYTNKGERALLFAYRREDRRVAFSAAVYNSTTKRFDVKTLDELDFTIPQTMDVLSFSSETSYVRYVQIDNKIVALSNAGEAIRIFWVGDEKKARKITEVTRPAWSSVDKLSVVHPDAAWINTASKTTAPAAETATAETLISSTSADNKYNYAYFYTFYNEIGETAPSQVTVVKAQRSYSTWSMKQPNSSGNPSSTTTSDPAMAMDQLVAILPQSVLTEAINQGALGWNLYGFTWSDQGSVPVEGTLLATKEFDGGTTQNAVGWLQHTAITDSTDATMPLPRADVRDNYTTPPTASQGLVVGDRIVLVYDKSNAARIRWSSNQLGEYINFSASKGGGYKTLTKGNLQVPACVKLWQNPQSVDTITILCLGLDGYSTAYYMSPNTSVSGSSSAVTIMGFEETTATPGTVSPYGVEVLNNALYHPLDPELMKSTASNYNISHKTMSDLIQNKWRELLHKENIVSSQLDNRLYYIVHNPDGAELEEGCMGNEVWVCDTATDGTWSRWLVQGQALRKLDLGGKLYMAIARPNGIFVFDEQYTYDEWPGSNNTTEQRAIAWKLETNTQGANRAHDAWANLQQVGLTLGSWQGVLKYGVRGWDIHGKPVEVSKIFKQLNYVDLSGRPLPFDIEDFLLIRKYMKEWFFFAGSVEDQGYTQRGYGQISLVQYRYSQATVNVGYEYGSVETFEYQRSLNNWSSRTTDNGVPIPVIDTRQP